MVGVLQIKCDYIESDIILNGHFIETHRISATNFDSTFHWVRPMPKGLCETVFLMARKNIYINKLRKRFKVQNHIQEYYGMVNWFGFGSFLSIGQQPDRPGYQ